MVEHASPGPGRDTTALGTALLDALLGFAGRLRWLGLDVSIAELTDGLSAVRDADLLDRARLRRLLMITMVKRAADLPTFESAFDLLFPAQTAAPERNGRSSDPDSGPAAGLPAGEPEGLAADPDLLSRLIAALRGDPGTGLQALAADTVSAFAGLDSGRVAGSERYYQYRVMRQLDIGSLLLRAMRLDQPELLTPVQRRVAAAERQDRLEDLRAQIAAELRARLTDLGGVDASLAALRDSVLGLDFLTAGPAELEAMRAAVRPLARRLAAAARRRRRLRSSGRLDVRRTMRRAIAAGGVPMDPAWQQRHRSRPRFLLLCDVSGSVAEFAKFTLSMVHALHAELPRLRSFVFADGLAEVTELLESSPGVIDTRLLLSRPGVVRGDGHSDYGAVLRHLLDEHGSAVSRDSVVIICGDARANYRPARADLLRAVHGQARQVHWLNPEPQASWDSTDSRIGEYRPECDTVTEVRNLRQLSAWVDTIL